MIELYVQVESEPINERARLYHTGNTISNHSYIDFIISCSTLYKTWPTRVTNKFYRAFDQYIYICIKCVRRPHFHARIQRERVQISFEINRKIVIFFFLLLISIYYLCVHSFSWWSAEASPARSTDVLDGRSTSPSYPHPQDTSPIAHHRGRLSARAWTIILGECTLRTFLLNYYIADEITQQVEIRRPVDPFPIVDIPFAVRRVHLPPSSVHTNDADTRVSRKTSGGESNAKLSFSEWEFVSRKHRGLYLGSDLHNKLCGGYSLARERKKIFFPRFTNKFLTPRNNTC